MNRKIVYVGIDTLYCRAPPALVKAGCRVCEIVSCPVDNETEFNLRTCAFAKEHLIPSHWKDYAGGCKTMEGSGNRRAYLLRILLSYSRG